MKITGVQAYVVGAYAIAGAAAAELRAREGMDLSWTFVQIDTDEGITGFGECSNYPGNGSLIVGDAVRRVREFVIGEDPTNITRLWHTLFRKAAYLGPRGLPTAIISGIDIALWDIKGKALNRPVYDLLGGSVRPAVPLYANAWFPGCETPEQYAEAARRVVATGHTAIKLDPFLEMRPLHTAYAY